MKKLYYTILATAAALTTASCVDLLNTAPENQIASENMWTTPELALKGMNGLYETFYNRKQSNGTQVRSENLDGLNKYGIEALGFCTDYYANNYPIYLLYNQAKRANDWQLAHEWRFCYTIVHAANDAVTNLHKAGLDAPTYERYLCEARFLRAWAYSRLNKFWQGVPVYLKPISNEQCTRTQESAEYVWREVVLPDLKYCIDNASFPDNTLGESNFGRPSKGAAYALRGMAYMWLKEWQNAANDFEQVGQCGYDLWRGEYIDFFSPDNERDNEMIFAIQYDEESGYCDNIQQAVGARDTYGGWDEVKPASDFVDYYQNNDGTEFKWSQVTGLENWDQLTPRQRAVFFCRDGLKSNAKLASQKTQAIGICGQDIFDRYYLDNGNEARIKAAYDKRDPRLKQTIVTPYEPVDCFTAGLNGDENMIGKQLRWPLYLQGTSGGDFWLDKRTSAYYCYRKYVRFLKGELIDRQRCYTDFPLIRYTDVILQWAEALIELNEFTPAKNLIDQVRARAHMPGITIGGLDAMREAVRYERRVEFPVEAVNFFDEVRWGTYKETKFQGQDVHGGQSWWGDNTVEYAWYWDDCLWPWSVPFIEMKKILILSAALLTGFFALSCGDSSSEPEDDPNMPAVKIEVGDIADNKATVTAALEKGNFYGAKIVTGVRVSTLTLDYTREIPLIKYVEANGTAAELPFTTQLTDLIFEQDYFCAVIVYDRTGRACHSAYLTFTAEGDPEGISNDNSAGNLEDNPQ